MKTLRWVLVGCVMGAAVLVVDGKRVREAKLASLPRFGLSYLHLQTLAEETDAEGTYFRLFRKEWPKGGVWAGKLAAQF